MDLIANISGTASRLGVSSKTVSSWIAQGKLKHYVRMNDKCVFINLSKEFPALFGEKEMPADGSSVHRQL